MNLIIIEGARGVGKTSVVQKLKNSTPQSMVFQLGGINKSENEKIDIYNHYKTLNNFIKNDYNLDYTLILDRTFISEAVYSKLYKDYIFDEEFYELLDSIKDIHINFVLLTTKDDYFEYRLKREKVEFQNIPYEKEKSINEQTTYIEYFDKLLKLNNDNFNIHIIENNTTIEECVFKIKNLCN